MKLLKNYLPYPLLIVIFFTLIKGLLWIAIIPPWQTPDEPAHFSYIQYLGEENRIPLLGEKPDGFSVEQQRFMIITKLNEIAFHPDVLASIDKASYQQLLSEKNRYKDRVSSGSSSATGYPPAYYWTASLFYKLFYNDSIVMRYYGVKLLSLILSLISVWAAYMIGTKITPESKSFPIALSILTGMQPMFSMISASINNDIMLDTISILILLWLFSAISNPLSISRKRLVVCGILFGLGLLTKAQLLYVCFFTSFILLIYLIKHKYNLTNIMKSFLFILIPTILLYGPWAFFSWKHYHSFLGAMGFQPIGNMSGSIAEYIKINFNISRISNLWNKMYWADFGWLDTTFPSTRLYDALFVIMIIGILGTSFSIIKYVKYKNGKWTVNSFSLICLLFYLGNIFFLYLVEFIYFKKYHTTMLQGRYLFTALVPLNIILLLGFRHWFPMKFKHVPDTLLSCAMILFNMASVILQLKRFYGFPLI